MKETTSHHFVEVDTITKPNPEVVASNIFRNLPGLKVMCVDCGEVRHLWPDDGKVETIINGNPDLHIA